MPPEHDGPTGDESGERATDRRTLSRRRMLQIGSAGVTMAALGITGVSAGSDELPNTLVVDGTGSPDPAAYDFLVSKDAAVHPDVGTNENGSQISGGRVSGTVRTNIHAYRFSGTVSYLNIDGVAEVSLLYGDEPPATVDRLEMVAPSDGAVAYQIESADPVTKVFAETDHPADAEDAVTETEDGTWVVEGDTRNGGGDTYDFIGSIDRIEPVVGDFTLFFNGQETTVRELTGQEPARDHWYSFEATGDEYVDYYLEVEEGGDLISSMINDAVVEDRIHWINDDGTKVAGRIQPGDIHTYAFDTLVADVTVEGEARSLVDGKDSDLSYYPREVASGDHWKGYFPWQLAGEERTHWYSFGATGNEYVDYYLEVEDGGELIPSMVDDATIEYEFFWIGDEGTKAAGRVQPGDTHAYAFDTLVADVTVEGDASTTVNGSDSSLDYYPRDSASGDAWKTGFPWQDDTHTAPTAGPDGIAMGGGAGYDSIVTRADANTVVNSASGLSSALSAASAGDTVFVDGDAIINTGGSQFDVPAGVTLASNRGEDGASGALLRTDDEPDAVVRMAGSDARVTGLRLRGAHPDSYVSHQNTLSYDNASNDGILLTGRNCEIDNTEIWGFVHAGVYITGGADGQQIHHNYIHQNNTQGYGYGVSIGYDPQLNPTIEYNYFNENRHSVTATGDNDGYRCRYNHFGPTSVMPPIDIHDPGSEDTTIERNIVETLTRTWDDNCCPAIGGFDGTEGVVQISGNWFWNDTCTYDVPVSDPDIELSGNDVGDGASSFAETIPDHPGGDHRPWA